MIIKFKERDNKVYFSNISVGQTFLFENSTFLKIQSVSRDTGCFFNAVTLAEGKVHYFEPTVKVEKLDHEVIIYK